MAATNDHSALDHAWSVVRAAHALVEAGLVVDSVGNISVRAGDSFLITPTRTPKPTLRAEDVVPVQPAEVPPRASREWPLHAAIYRARPEVGAVVHTHSVHATAWSFLGRDLEPALEDTEYYGIGTIRTAAYAPPASEALASGAASMLAGSKAVLLARHGVVTCAESLDEAVAIARVVERQAQVAWLLRTVS